MEQQRSLLILGLAMVSFLLWQQWQVDYGPKPIEPIVSEQATNPVDQGVPSSSTGQQLDNNATSANSDVPAAQATPSVELVKQNNLITVTTDTLEVVISPVGGDVVSANLVKYPVTQGSTDSYSLLRPDNGLYVAQSGLVGANGPDGNPAGRPRYDIANTNYEMSGEVLTIPLTWRNSEGLSVTKTFTFTRGHNDVEVSYQIQNSGSQAISVQQYAQLKQVFDIPEGNMFMPTYRGAAYSTVDDRFEKYTFDDIQDADLRETTAAGWVAMLEHYFVAAWVPPQDQNNNLYSRAISNDFAIIGYTGEPVTVQPNGEATISSTLYMGPKDQEKLGQLARGLDLTVDYGILWWIAQPLFELLKFLHSLVGNWGVAIILITVIVKGAMYWLTKKQYESMAKMRNLAPKMQQIKDRVGDDRQKMSQAMMELYRKEKVNPMGGCLPLILQMPIFLALYWVFLESVELRHAEFFLWITDLSVKDPFYVLPILTGISMFLLQKLQPNTITDPLQQKLIQWMPVMMSIFFLWFPAGLVLYWLISNVITLIQAKMIYASMEKRGIK